MSFTRIKPIFKREFTAYFNSPIAYIFAAVFLLAGNWLFWQRFFLNNQASLRAWFDFLPWILLLLAPALTMRSWAEEKKSGTIEFLLTLPVKDGEVVLAKFLAALAFWLVALILTITTPITIARLGNLDSGATAGAYIGAFLLGGAYISIGLFMSALASNQIVAFLGGMAALFALFIIGTNFVLVGVGNFLGGILSFISTSAHFDSVMRGALDTRDVIYYLSFIALFLYLNKVAIGSRHWR